MREVSQAVIEEALAGRHVLVTGVTGFLGQAVLERLLAEMSDTRVTVLVRPRRGSSGQERLRRLLSQPVFASWRERVGDEEVTAAFEQRVRVVEGGLDEVPALPTDLDVVIHCAATVSFDPPIDEAFRTNLLGLRRLYEAVGAAGSRPHVVHVSTAYSNGVRRGVVAEGPLRHRVDWRAEAEAAMGARADVERASRRPEVLDKLAQQARAEHRKAGPQAVASDIERRRTDWVQRRLVSYGRARADSLGWPDVYTMTKALGERAGEELAATHGLPLSIVRPSIVESALAHPHPGWIEGFKMAEPLILAYGRGDLPEFPGVPEAVVDIIPVDLVANAVVAAAATVPTDGPRYYHVGSGARNPLTFRGLYEHVRAYFQRDPVPDPDRGEVAVPEWRFPGKRRVEQLLRIGERVVEGADTVVGRLPRSERTRELATRVGRERRRVEFMRRYADLYGGYVEAEVIFSDDNTLALQRSLPPGDRTRFGFDAAEFDWRTYLQDVHCPSVASGLRRPAPTSAPPAVLPERQANDVVAVFDLEGTVLSSNTVESYLWLRLADLPFQAWPAELADVARALPRLMTADRRDRAEFLRSFYRHYEGASVEGIRRLVADHATEVLLSRAAPAALRRVRRHRSCGHRTLLLTGALEPLVEPLTPLFDRVVAARLDVQDGRYTGYLAEPPLVGEARAAWLQQYADEEGMDLKSSWAYADSHSDLPLLEAVGSPVAVNPDTSLYRVARRRRWPVERWEASQGAGKAVLTRRERPVSARGSR